MLPYHQHTAVFSFAMSGRVWGVALLVVYGCLASLSSLSGATRSQVTSVDCGFYNTTEISDPIGDATPYAPAYVDITKLTIRQIGQYVQFVWEANENPYNEDQQCYFLIFDTDFNPNTGQRWDGAGGELKIGIYHTADLIYFDGAGNVVNQELGFPVLFEGNRFYLSVEKWRIPAEHFNLYFESSGGTVYSDFGSLNEIALQPEQGEKSLVMETEGMILHSNPPLINIPSKTTLIQLYTYLMQDGTKTLLSPNEVTFSVTHPVHNPILGEPSSIISVDSNGLAQYLSEGYVFASAYSNACYLTSDRVILATGAAYGDPQQDSVLAVFPPDYMPEGSLHSFGEMMTNHPNYTRTVNLAYDITSDLYNQFRPFDGEKQIFALLVIPDHCGGNGNPLETAPCCYMNCGDATPHYNVVIHEMGHNFGYARGMTRLTTANNDRLGGAGLGECVASLPVIYIASEFHNHPEAYGIAGDSFEWNYYENFLQSDIPYAQSQLEDFEALINSGQTEGVFDNGGKFDGVAVFCSFFQLFSYNITPEYNPYGNEMIRRFLNIFDDLYLPDFQEAKVETYFAAAYSKAVGKDMRSTLRFWGFTIDDGYYEQIYPTIGMHYRSFLPVVLH